MRGVAALALSLVVGAGCSAMSDYPLGGSHGGASASSPQPPNGSSYGVGSSDDAGAPSTTGRDAGTGSSGTGSGGGASSAPSDGGTTFDAGPTESEEAGASQPLPAPTWTAIHTDYLAAGTIGNCPSCHVEMTTPPGAYAWLEQEAALDSLDDPNASVLSWYGGGMPKHGATSEPSAVAAIDAWAAAGRLDN